MDFNYAVRNSIFSDSLICLEYLYNYTCNLRDYETPFPNSFQGQFTRGTTSTTIWIWIWVHVIWIYRMSLVVSLAFRLFLCRAPLLTCQHAADRPVFLDSAFSKQKKHYWRRQYIDDYSSWIIKSIVYILDNHWCVRH